MCSPDVDPALCLVLLVKRRCHVVYLTTPSVVTCQEVIVSKWSWRIRMWPGLQTPVWFSWIRVEGWIAGPVCLLFMLFLAGRSQICFILGETTFCICDWGLCRRLADFLWIKGEALWQFPISACTLHPSSDQSVPDSLLFPSGISHINQWVWASHTDVWTVGCQLLSVVSRVKCVYPCLAGWVGLGNPLTCAHLLFDLMVTKNEKVHSKEKWSKKIVFVFCLF